MHLFKRTRRFFASPDLFPGRLARLNEWTGFPPTARDPWRGSAQQQLDLSEQPRGNDYQQVYELFAAQAQNELLGRVDAATAGRQNARSTTLPRLGSWVRIPSPLQKLLITQRLLRRAPNTHSATVGRTKHEDTPVIREKSGKFVNPLFVSSLNG